MKIPLIVRTYAEGKKPFATVSIKIPQSRTIHGRISPFVDTGSPWTVISKTDADRLHIIISGTPRTVYLGGAPILSYPLQNVTLKALWENKKSVCDMSMPTIGVIQPIPHHDQSIKSAGSTPSIIGADLLERHRLALYFDIYNEISYLKKV